MKDPDWHRKFIVAELQIKGTSISALARANNVCRSTIANALIAPYPKSERIIAEALGLEPAEIWPSRYSGQFSTGVAVQQVDQPHSISDLGTA